MLEDFKPVRVDPIDPTRCQAIGANGDQCPFQGMRDPTIVPGAGGMSERDVKFLKYCRMHGSAVSKAVKKEARRLYLASKWRSRMDAALDPEVGTNLDEELAVLRMTLQIMLEKYEEVELLNNVQGVSALVRDIRETLKDNKKVKSQMGELLDRAAIHKLSDAIVLIIGEHVAPAQLDKVAAQVAGAIAQAVSARSADKE